MVYPLPKEGNAQYQNYLLGDHWRAFRLKVLAERRECQECGIDYRKAVKLYRQWLNVHHLTYERIGQEKPADVEVLCYGCHMKQHGLGDWVDFVSKFAMPQVGEGSQQMCQVCGILKGPRYFNVEEASSEWVCLECRT